jgi:hypothetical protein
MFLSALGGLVLLHSTDSSVSAVDWENAKLQENFVFSSSFDFIHL